MFTVVAAVAVTSVVDSEAHFLKRAAEVHLAQDSIDALQLHGFRSLGQLAFAVGQPGQVIPEADFQQFCKTVVPSASQASIGSISRLLFEAQTLSVQQLRLQLTSPESVSKHVSEAERDRRLTALRGSLTGLCIEGPLEPGRKLLDECSHQDSLGQLKYLAPERCVSRLHEVTHAKQPAKQVSLEQNRLVALSSRKRVRTSQCQQPRLSKLWRHCAGEGLRTFSRNQ